MSTATGTGGRDHEHGPILVTGGTGTPGRLVVPRLRDAGGKVRVLSRRSREAGEGIEFVTGDLASGEGIEAAVEGAEIIVHCAGSSLELVAVLQLPPETVSMWMRLPDAGTPFVFATNGSMEWLLLPPILLFNWESPRRRAIVVAALVFYLERVWTYTYFAPVITAIQGDFADGVAISQLLPDFEQWSRLT